MNVCLSESLEAVAMNESQLITGEAVTFVFVHGGVASRAFTLMRMMHLVYAGSKHLMLYIYILYNNIYIYIHKLRIPFSWMECKTCILACYTRCNIPSSTLQFLAP